jgi:dipeptidyl aminopeptidase/acylaminoacyl peptidase
VLPPRSPDTLPKPRRFRGLGALLGVCALGFTLHVTGREAIARAVAYAPNAGQHPVAAPQPLPESLARHGAFTLTTRVGPPSASLVSWVAPELGAAVRGTIVLLHGVRMDKRSLVPEAVALIDAGYRVVLVDLRGHGESTGDFLTYGTREAADVDALLSWLETKASLGPLGVFGFSYGGAVALALAALEPKVQAVVAVSTFSTLRGVVTDYRNKYLPGPLKLIPDAWFQGAVDDAAGLAQFDPDTQSPLNAVERSNERLLLIHGAADTQVPPRHSLALAAAAGSRATVVTLPGATHDSMPADPTGAVARESVRWFERWLTSAGG